MSTPCFLVRELQSAFRLCARQHIASRTRPSQLSPIIFLRQSSKSSNSGKKSKQNVSFPNSNQQSSVGAGGKPAPTTLPKEVMTQEDSNRALQEQRKADVPMKPLPRADASSTKSLSPIQRLHIEHLTRHPPRNKPLQVAYKEKLLIYNVTRPRVFVMVFSRVLSMGVLAYGTFILVPAHFVYGSPIYIIALKWLATLIPVLWLNWAYRGIAIEVWLRLPPLARKSAQTAMAYAKNLPRDAELLIRYLGWTSVMKSVILRVADVVPASNRFKPVSFKWVGPRVERGTWLSPNATEYFVWSVSGGGKAARNTIPGLWSPVYTRLTGKQLKPVPGFWGRKAA